VPLLLAVVGAIALLILVVAFFLFFHLRNRSATQDRSVSKSQFAELPESVIPGRYKWSDGPKEFLMVLYEDHTFMNQDGTTFPMYRWDVRPEGLSITWQRNTSWFTNIEAPGVYMARTTKGTIARMEKLPPYDPSQLVAPKPIAAIRLGAQCETNGLTPVNTGSDGQIYPANVGGAPCYQLRRKDNRPDGYLYLQIAPELKEPPFTNALVVIEYFDAAPAEIGPGRLAIQYDSQIGVYANAQPLPLNGSDTWQEATFFLARPLFQNRQNAGGDFRLCATGPDLFVRSVKLVKNTILPEAKLPTSTPVK